MFNKVPESQIVLEEQLSRALHDLENYAPTSDDFKQTLKVVSKLHEMKEKSKSSSVSKDTLAIVGTNLLGILLIIRHEHVNVITSRAMNMVLKPK